MKKLIVTIVLLLGAATSFSLAHAAGIVKAAGSLDSVQGKTAYGWAAETNSLSKVVSVIIFDGPANTGNVIGHGATTLLRNDVNRYLNESTSAHTHGFQIALDTAPTSVVYAYAVMSDGTLASIGAQRPVPAPIVTPPSTAPGTIPPINESDWSRGNLSTAKVVMIEYTGLQDPFAQRLHPYLADIKEKYGNDVAWVYRPFPFSFHPEDKPAALAAECVGEQLGDDAFFAFIDAMFAQQDKLGRSFYIATADRFAGINMDMFTSCFDSGKYNAKIDAIAEAATSAGVNVTPTTFVNGEKILGAVPEETFVTTINRLLGR